MKTALYATTVLSIFVLQILSTSEVKADRRAASWRGQSVMEFTSDENEKLEWQIVNDGVMGGLSEGNLEFTDKGTMKFFGELSLKDNGGFATARSAAVDLNLSNDLGLLLNVKGDGRTYQARLDSDARFRGATVSFSGEFTTRRGEWRQIKIPFTDFKGSFRGTDLPDETLNPAAIERVWILLGDKKEGAFSLEVDWIRTFGKGQGNFTESKSKGEGKKVAKDEKAASDGPSSPQSLIDTAVADGRFSILKTALDRAGLTAFFQWDNKLTVFAPTDEAFEKLPEGVLENLLKPANKSQLIALLSYQVSPGDHGLPEMLSSGEVEAVEGGRLEVKFAEGRVRVNDAAVIDAGVECSDGLIHVIDSVLTPSSGS